MEKIKEVLLKNKYITEKNEISYPKEIISHRELKKITGDEELVRGYFLYKLINELGYDASKIELEKEYEAGRPKTIKPRIDVILKDNNDNPFLFVELKSPEEYDNNIDKTIEDQLYSLAGIEQTKNGTSIKYLVLYTIDIDGDNIKDKCTIIDYQKYNNVKAWQDSRDYLNELPKNYGKAIKKPYKKGSKKDLDTNFTHERIDAIRKNLHNVLWGGGSTTDNEIFTSLVNLILAKIQDESECKNNEDYEFQIKTFNEKDEKEQKFETNEQIFERINSLYRRALKVRLGVIDEKKLEKSYVVDENKFSLSKLRYTVSELEGFSFVEGKNNIAGKDILGDFFEGMIRDGFKQSKGQFFTHTNIVKFLLYGMKLDELAIDFINNDRKLPYCIDPTSGSGTFLIEYMKMITHEIKYRQKDKINTTRDIEDKIEGWFYPDNKEHRWAKDFIYGIDSNFDLGSATKVNMILHGDGSSNIFIKDGLLPFNQYIKNNEPNALKSSTSDKNYKKENNKDEKGMPVNAEFDVIISNPPFSVTIDNDTKENLPNNFLFPDKKNSENLFIERWYQLLRENGRLGVVLPESVFDTTENKYIRLFLYKYFKIKAVVSLPQLTFEPYTSTKTSLLFAQKKTEKEIEYWDNLWKKYSDEWGLLSTRINNEIDFFVKDKKWSNKWAIAKETEEQRKNNVIRMLQSYLMKNDEKLALNEIVVKYQDELNELKKHDNDTIDMCGYVNTSWVFEEIAREFKYSIFMAEVENIGYKRTKRGIKEMPNELFRTSVNKNGKIEIAINDNVKETALDYLREIQWD